jgi:tetratricopeptide (TPR) repeat protein
LISFRLHCELTLIIWKPACWRARHYEGAIDEAVKELEEAYHYDEDAPRYPLIRALLAQAESTAQTGREGDALNIYQRVLELSPREAVAREKLAEIRSVRRRRALESIAAEIAILVQDEEWDKAAPPGYGWSSHRQKAHAVGE